MCLIFYEKDLKICISKLKIVSVFWVTISYAVTNGILEIKRGTSRSEFLKI